MDHGLVESVAEGQVTHPLEGIGIDFPRTVAPPAGERLGTRLLSTVSVRSAGGPAHAVHAIAAGPELTHRPGGAPAAAHRIERPVVGLRHELHPAFAAECGQVAEEVVGEEINLGEMNIVGEARRPVVVGDFRAAFEPDQPRDRIVATAVPKLIAETGRPLRMADLPTVGFHPENGFAGESRRVLDEASDHALEHRLDRRLAELVTFEPPPAGGSHAVEGVGIAHGIAANRPVSGGHVPRQHRAIEARREFHHLPRIDRLPATWEGHHRHIAGELRAGERQCQFAAGGRSGGQQVAPNEMLHCLLRRDPGAAAVTPPRSALRDQRQTQAVSFLCGELPVLEELRTHAPDRVRHVVGGIKPGVHIAH